ncbi:DUF6765 family protein [candidate division KSB1 bacterium]
MQKDIHFYLTFALAKKAGISEESAQKIAWANQYTDDMTEPEEHEIQTQCGLAGNWADHQIQATVLVPFHFIPGKDNEHPWKTMPNNANARRLVREGIKAGDPIQLGIALHGLQDTFSHQGFSGWKESLNSCFPWYYVTSALPNVGHAEMRVVPDVVSQNWTDPRTNKKISNKVRALSAAKATLELLCKFSNEKDFAAKWLEAEPKLRTIFKATVYDARKEQLKILSGNKNIRYSEIRKNIEKNHKGDFIFAARRHLSVAMHMFKDYPY